ncbi:hypothetical protein H9N25_05750 [Pedobacter riviphilus]|uniref:Uncharacterized protein n=1 Tax=Pedobacter riviphilus TaxID=2766984 RepID=A0ABX6TLZ5_9SPHI|nr:MULTISPECIES: hypothetical protein [Pedobacter]NII82157.1 hypothetical protein [Pedobacter sp. SG908]NMN36175.1 hypothetical protein [Pedobacter sp. SG918]QNR85946.1 hypothetical protein H9N25_05750 [Pedobacter riviphilus]
MNINQLIYQQKNRFVPDYYPQVIKELREQGMIGQAIVNVKGSTTLFQIEQEVGRIEEYITIMPVVDMKRADASAIIVSYNPHQKTLFKLTSTRIPETSLR